MRIDKIYIEEFKNLRNFSIDLNEEFMSTVFLGQNAAGKSNLLEALVIIFRDLDLEDQTDFNYILEYQCKENLLKVKGGPDVRGKFQFYKGVKIKNTIAYETKVLSKKLIREKKSNYLPRYVFSYYSGVSNRLLEHFDKHQTRFYKALLENKNQPSRPLFYARLIHSHFVLMAFYAFPEKKINDFLKEYLNIIDFESVLFVLKKPIWKRNNNPLDFWGADGVVRKFLDELWESSVAPISHKEKVREDFNKYPEQDHLYLYISNRKKLQEIASKYLTNTEFFKSLESTYISDLIHEVRVKVKKENVKGDITFKELSEGEQQLLTVLGLLRFTKEDESLILLDEPDTHLNPLWKWKYMNLLEEYSGKDDSSQILMTTHDPLVIGGLTKEEIRIFQAVTRTDDEGAEYQHIEAIEPDFDPKGLGVAGILTSEFFNLPSTLDEETQNELNEYRSLEVKEKHGELTEEDKTLLTKYAKYFEELGFNKYTRDPLYAKFIEKTANLAEFKSIPQTKEEQKRQDDLTVSILEDLLKEDKE